MLHVGSFMIALLQPQTMLLLDAEAMLCGGNTHFLYTINAAGMTSWTFTASASSDPDIHPWRSDLAPNATLTLERIPQLNHLWRVVLIRPAPAKLAQRKFFCGHAI